MIITNHNKRSWAYLISRMNDNRKNFISMSSGATKIVSYFFPFQSLILFSFNGDCDFNSVNWMKITSTIESECMWKMTCTHISWSFLIYILVFDQVSPPHMQRCLGQGAAWLDITLGYSGIRIPNLTGKVCIETQCSVTATDNLGVFLIIYRGLENTIRI